MTHIILDTGGL